MQPRRSRYWKDFPCIATEVKCKLRVTSLLIFGESHNISEVMSQESFPKFMQLQSVTQLLLQMLLVKLKFFTFVSMTRLLNTTGISCKVSDTTVEDAEKSIQTVCYTEKEEESLTETTVRLYKQMKTTSQFLPANEKSMLQAFKRDHYQVYYSSRVDKIIIRAV